MSFAFRTTAFITAALLLMLHASETDAAQESATSRPSQGLGSNARWIAASSPTTAPAADIPLPIFRRSFQVKATPIRRAVIAICGLGQFELHLNGEKVGVDVMEPGWTNYRKTCLFVDHDVTSKLHAGENVLGVMLGNGMYNIPVLKGRYAKFHGSFGPPKLIAELTIEYTDGSLETIDTDDKWRLSSGPITFSSIYGGEDYDARLEKLNWDRSGFDDSAWATASEVDGPGGVLVGPARAAPPLRVAAVFKAKKITQPKPGLFVYDLGQNCSMMPRFTVRGSAGAKVRLMPAELLKDDGTVSQTVVGGPTYCVYTLKGEGDELWGARFSYFGARWAQVEGAVPVDQPNPSNLPVVVNLEGDFITSTSPIVGEFSCSNQMFNQTASIIRWAMRSNMVSLLTDCPHRERLGWLEQDHLVGPSLMYNFNVSALFDKICWDMADTQTADGLVPDIAPEYVTFKGSFRDSPEWGSACVLIPWQMYQWYGDTKVLSEHYDVMKRYVAYLGTKAKDQILSYGLGDWYDLGPKRPGQAQLTPTSLTATAFYYRDITVLEQAAKLLGHDDDGKQFASLAREVRDAFNKSLYHPETHNYATGSQCANAIPLVFGLAPEEDRGLIVENIVTDIRKRDNGLTAGDIGYRYLLRALAEAGRSDVIFDMNSRSDRPGYGMILAKDNTSLTEGWDGSNSRNHFMLGHIMEWFYGNLAGIQQAAHSVGFGQIVIQPTPVGDVTWAKATYQCPHGEIGSSWTLAGDGKFTLDVSIPSDTTAAIYLPTKNAEGATESGRPLAKDAQIKIISSDGESIACRVAPGKYHFEAATK